MSISKWSLEKLRCTTCQKYLSVSPIHISENSNYTCGRCDPIGSRDTAYEEIAQYIIFPCSYENCGAQIPWHEVKKHESECVHKPILCPFYNCPSKYGIQKLPAHFETYHWEFVYENQVEGSLRNLARSGKTLLLSHQGGKFVVFCIRTQTSDDFKYSYSFGVFCVNSVKTGITYNAIIRYKCDDETPTFMMKRNQKIEPYNENLNCLRCLQNNCTVKHHTARWKTFLNSRFNNLNEHIYLNGSFTIEIVGNTDHGMQNDLKMTLECPICKELMSYPIYNCKRGHAVCASCKRRLDRCPICKERFGHSRNYALEDIAGRVKIPCSNVGCNFVGTVTDLAEHETYCKFA